MKTKNLSEQYRDYIVDLRREFHMNPELSWQEHRTSERVKEELRKIGVPFIAAAKTGVIATIRGSQPGGVLALRADMDALQVKECNDVPYASKNDGVMHACGHDGHTAMLLGAAKILNDMKDEIKGTVKLLFQPAEELAQGAKLMIEDGCMEGLDGIFGIHLWSDLQVGKVSVEAGPRMASADMFTINIKGLGGHGSLPHQGVDAVLTASSLVMNLQSIVSREISPMDAAVVSVGVLNSGTRFNVIASEALLEGTTRCFNQEVRKLFPKAMERIVTSTAENYRAQAKLEYRFGTPPTINDARCSKIAEKTVTKLFGENAVSLMEKVTGGEDFAEYLEKAPGVIAFVGVRNEDKQCCYAQHHERFNIDEDALTIGAAVYAQYAMDFLAEK